MNLSIFYDLVNVVCLCLETRTSGSKQVWELLHHACTEEEATALALIEACDLQLPQNSLTTAID
jgi:hypothetical protein